MSDLNWDTATVAELHLQQGDLDAALAVYRRLLSSNPGDELARERLQELCDADALGSKAGFGALLEWIISEAPGARVCAVMGLDGVVVERRNAAEHQDEYEDALVELSLAARRIAQGGDKSPALKDPRCFALRLRDLTALCYWLDDDYICVALIGDGESVESGESGESGEAGDQRQRRGLAARAAYVLRRAVPGLRRELRR